MTLVLIIRRSMAAFTCGLVSALVLVVTVPAILAILGSAQDESGKVTADPAGIWVPVMLLLLITIVPAILSLVEWLMVHFRFRSEWNPASAYLNWGTRLAAFALLFTMLVICIVALVLS